MALRSSWNENTLMSWLNRKNIKKNLVKNKPTKVYPKQSQLITINNYKKFYKPKLPTETLSSTQLNFVTSGNEVLYNIILNNLGSNFNQISDKQINEYKISILLLLIFPLTLRCVFFVLWSFSSIASCFLNWPDTADIFRYRYQYYCRANQIIKDTTTYINILWNYLLLRNNIFLLQRTKIKGNLLIIDKEQVKQVRKSDNINLEPSSVISIDVKKWQNPNKKKKGYTNKNINSIKNSTSKKGKKLYSKV